MTDPEIAAIVAKIEAATGPDRDIDGWITCAIDPDRQTIVDHVPGQFPQEPIYGPIRCIMEETGGKDGADYIAAPAYTASIDAAMSLVPDNARLQFQSFGGPGPMWLVSPNERYVSAATPALALCAAALRAHLQGETK
jgi:hypothetical protein